MSKILVAVGGTGQEIALAALRICQMAGPGSLDLPQLFVFDSDIGAKDQVERPTRFGILQKLHKQILTNRAASPAAYIFHHIEPRRVDEIADNQFSSLFSAGGGAIADPTSNLLKLLVPQEVLNNITISDGFHGQPMVGAVAFADHILHGGLGGPFFNPLFQMLHNGDPSHTIAIVGGTGGGTGPGIIPVLAAAIRSIQHGVGLADLGLNIAALAPNIRQIIRTSILVQLPWFHLTPAGDLSEDAMKRNSACLVRLYRDELPSLADRVLVLGLPSAVERTSQGPNLQAETNHWFNLFSGWLALELLANSQAIPAPPNQAMLGYDLDGGADSRMNWEHALRTLKLTPIRQPDQPLTPLPLQRVVDTSRMMIAFLRGLRRQLQHPYEVALPLPVWRAVANVGPDLEDFRKELEALESFEADNLTWYLRSFLNAPKDFELTESMNSLQSFTSVREIAKQVKLREGRPPAYEHELVAWLLPHVSTELLRKHFPDNMAPDLPLGGKKALAVCLAARDTLIKGLLA